MGDHDMSEKREDTAVYSISFPDDSIFAVEARGPSPRLEPDARIMEGPFQERPQCPRGTSQAVDYESPNARLLPSWPAQKLRNEGITQGIASGTPRAMQSPTNHPPSAPSPHKHLSGFTDAFDTNGDTKWAVRTTYPVNRSVYGLGPKGSKMSPRPVDRALARMPCAADSTGKRNVQQGGLIRVTTLGSSLRSIDTSLPPLKSRRWCLHLPKEQHPDGRTL